MQAEKKMRYATREDVTYKAERIDMTSMTVIGVTVLPHRDGRPTPLEGSEYLLAYTTFHMEGWVVKLLTGEGADIPLDLLLRRFPEFGPLFES